MSRSNLVQNLLTGILALCAVIVTLLVVRRELFPPKAEAAVPVATVRNWRDFGRDGHRRGPDDAPVTIVEFSDFQCPFCRAMAARLDTLREEYPGKVAVVYRHYPLPIHEHAVAAARAADCAAEQGRFWPMHDVLFQRQDAIGKTEWRTFGSAAQVPDTTGFRRCLGRESGTMQRDREAGRQLQVDRTPTLLVNQHRIVGAVPLDTLRAYVRRAMRAQSVN